jgi:DNA-binding beta-propeller fold protein YncE
MKRLAFMMFFLMLGMVCMVSAEPKAIGLFVNSNTNCIQFIYPDNVTSSPMLAGQLGSYGGGLFDVVITSDGKTAAVSNFGDSRIFFIDISNACCCNPLILASTRIPFFAEDMALTPDDKYLVVTDGGFSNRAAVIDMSCFNLLKNNPLGSNKYANAVAITPDGKTAVFADYFQGAVYAYELQNGGILVFKNKAKVLPIRPVNIAISPDGKTVIAVNAGGPSLAALYFDNSGNLYLHENVAMPFRNGQSCVFNKTGDKAYYLSNSQTGGTKVVVLNVGPNPGDVSPSGTNITIFPKKGTSQLFGVDTIALDPSGNYLYVANPTLSGGLQGIDVIDLTIGAKVDSIKGTGIPTGIAFTTIDCD